MYQHSLQIQKSLTAASDIYLLASEITKNVSKHVIW